LTISGTGLANATSVTIGGTAASIQSNTDLQIVVTVSPAQPTGQGLLVTVTTPGGVDGSHTVDVIPPPTVTGVMPNPVALGANLTISGNALDNATVTVGGTSTAIQTNTSAQIVVVVSASHTPGAGQQVVVTTPAGTDSTATVDVLPLPVVTAVSPNPVFRGDFLTISGTDLDNTLSVTIGGADSTIQANTSAEIVVLVGNLHPVGANLPVVVATPGGIDGSQTVTVQSKKEAPGTSGGSSTGCTARRTHASLAAWLLAIFAGAARYVLRCRQARTANPAT
jgi:hypothetical protein